MLGAFAYNNNVQTTLDTAINDSVATVLLDEATAPLRNPPTSASATRPARFTLMDDPSAPTKIEIIQATGVSAPSAGVVTLTGVTRGLEGTTAQSWGAGSFVMQMVTQAMLNPETIRYIGPESFAGIFGNGAGAWERVIKVRDSEGVCLNPDGDSFFARITGLLAGNADLGAVAANTIETKGTVDIGQNLNVSGVGSFPAGGVRITLGAPASSSATGAAGQIRVSADFLFVCTATNTWKRVALSTF